MKYTLFLTCYLLTTLHVTAQQWKFKTGGRIFSSPIIYADKVFTGSEDGHLYAVNARTGKQVWKYATAGAVNSTPAAENGVIYFGSYDGCYYAVDALTGRLQWKFKTGGEKKVSGKGLWTMQPKEMEMEDQYDLFLSSPVVSNDVVYFGSSDHYIYAVHTKDGSLKWKFKTNGLIHAGVAVYNGKVYAGSWDTWVYALNAEDGSLNWKFKTGEHPEYHVLEGIQATPVIAEGVLYIGSRDSYFYALNAENGALKWKYSADNAWIVGSAVVEKGIVYVGTSDSFLFLALNAATGKEKYRVKNGGYIFGAPALTGNIACYGDFTGSLQFVEKSTGELLNSFKTKGYQKHAETILDSSGYLNFTYTAEGRDPVLYKTNVDVMETFYKLGPIATTPVIQKGVVYFTSADGYLYALPVQKGVEGH